MAQPSRGFEDLALADQISAHGVYRNRCKHASALGGAQPCRRSARPGPPPGPAELSLDVIASSEQGSNPAALRVHQ
jgi:hypothetical protein